MTPLDAAARAWFDRGQAQRLDAGRKRPDGQSWQWDDLTEDDRRAYRALVAPIVEAVEAAWRDRPGPDPEGVVDMTDAEFEAFRGAAS